MANVKTSTRAICEAAIFIALSLALGYVRFKIWAQGGSVNLAMIPIIVFSLRWGARWGIGASAVYGFLRCLLLDGMGMDGKQFSLTILLPTDAAV